MLFWNLFSVEWNDRVDLSIWEWLIKLVTILGASLLFDLRTKTWQITIQFWMNLVAGIAQNLSIYLLRFGSTAIWLWEFGNALLLGGLGVTATELFQLTIAIMLGWFLLSTIIKWVQQTGLVTAIYGIRRNRTALAILNFGTTDTRIP